MVSVIALLTKNWKSNGEVEAKGNHGNNQPRCMFTKAPDCYKSVKILIQAPKVRHCCERATNH